MFGEEIIDLKKVTQRAIYLAKQIKNVIEPITIRRNRLDLRNNPFYKDEVKSLSKIADPKEWFFELTKEQSVCYELNRRSWDHFLPNLTERDYLRFHQTYQYRIEYH
ncbi:hypothetical protein MCHI_003038 [Candidatus Magnetoovum chiemensis]|nr:hypothetical protein MCHI_003038 [Candidatus Magnetoovum chiemensis]